MATLKDHQQAMVDLLAYGSGIPASSLRLAHAMLDVLCHLTEAKSVTLDMKSVIRAVEANSPGLNDKALAADVEACRPKDTMFDRARAAERRVKELENTVNQLREVSRASRDARIKELENTVTQLRASNAAMRLELAKLRVYAEHDAPPEQAGCRKDDTQESGLSATKGFLVSPGARFVCTQGKDDTQVCEHTWVEETEYGTPTGVSICTQCGAAKL